ncbi:hypothetical protein F511_43992 [Dorcoceras hygrometricum]|uniref:Uncharacterized protein n=1 Tax=Dorcoceras hygrometricum TaxID=472368 RepID=A0A2Z7CVC7_9LAMI|nr:hypothetical protein F511_43992 [Dorcoceras hygrometricum]
MGIDQLKLHSVQPGYLKNLQRPTKTQAAQKQGKETRSNLSTKSTHKTANHKTCNIHIMICMSLSRKIGHLGQQLSWKISIEPQHHAQPIIRWKSSIRDLQVHRPSQLSGLQARRLSRPPHSIEHFQARQLSRQITMLARLGSSIKHQAQYVFMNARNINSQIHKSIYYLNQISPGHDTNSLFKSASLLAYGKAQQKLTGSSNLSKHLTNQLKTKPIQLTAYGQELIPATTTLLKTNQLKSERKTLNKAYPRAQTDRENYRPEIREDART